VPLSMIVLNGLPGLVQLSGAVWLAAARSIGVALAATFISLVATLILALAIERGRGARMMELAGMLPLAASSLVLGTGLFLTLRPFVSPEEIALPITVLVNAAMTLPYALRLVLPGLRGIEADYGRLADALGLLGRARLRWLILPRLRAQLGFAAGVVAALSMGDLGVIALFAGDKGATLPLMVQQLMGAYRMEQAAGAALLLVLLSFGLFWIFDRGARNA
jgi:thiamine transport system permease protein